MICFFFVMAIFILVSLAAIFSGEEHCVTTVKMAVSETAFILELLLVGS